MARNSMDLTALEGLRETGDYDKIALSLTNEWQSAPEFNEVAVRLRMLAAELAGRNGSLAEMEVALAPYIEDVGLVPFSLAPRVLLMLGTFHYRRNEPSEALRLARLSDSVSGARGDEVTQAEAIQLAGQALWSLERWNEAASSFEQAIDLYASQTRSYRLGLAYLCLGAVKNRVGRVEDARTLLERSIKILLKSQDEYNLAVARVNIALALNTTGEHEMALKYLIFAFETFERISHVQYAYLTLNNIAATYAWLKEYDKAEEYCNRALEMGVKARSTQIATTYEIKARVNIARREWEKAERSLEIALEIAEQANSLSQKAEVRRTLSKLYLMRDRNEEAATLLWAALDMAEDLRASLLELEVKALLAQAICATNPVEACRLISDVEAALSDRLLPEIRREAQAARRRINSLDQEHYFILSDVEIPRLANAKISLLKWLWARALYKARGNAREAAAILGVTPTYIRKLTKVIPRDLLRPGRKRAKKQTAGV